MSARLNITEEEGSNNLLVASSASTDSTCQNRPGLKARNYMSLSDCSSVESNVLTTLSEEKDTSLNLKATELRLGLPGSQSPARDSDISLLNTSKLDEKPLFPVHPSKDGVFSSVQKNVASGNKRGFSDAMDGFSETKSSVFTETNWMFPSTASESQVPQSLTQGKFAVNQGFNSVLLPNHLSNPGAKAIPLKDQSGPSPQLLKEIAPPKLSQDKARNHNDGNRNQTTSNCGNAPAAKAQVVGWPPIRSFRKNTLTSTSKNNDEVDGKQGSVALFVKVSMDGAPYLRKVDLKTYSSYLELSSALEKMFSCFTIGQCGSHGVSGRDSLSESNLKDLLHGSEYVLTYEDKDGDWMLVGDVPWEMFIDSCKRMRIMKSSDAIGLGSFEVQEIAMAAERKSGLLKYSH